MYTKTTGAVAAGGGVGSTALAHTGAGATIPYLVAAVTLILTGAALTRLARTRKRNIN